MNFFEHQDRAHSQSRWLFLAFLAAVIVTVFAVDIVLLIFFGVTPSGGSYLATFDSAYTPLAGPTTRELLSANMVLLMAGGAIVVLVIGAASLFRIASLRGGGGHVAQGLGGILVDAGTADPSLRRLQNVVEEIAIAAGVPVPEVYVLEREPGINAFAAGYTPSDAAIAVTRGCLDTLSRSELQGVIAHEYSHIFNGDMRLNIRMMGLLFGILVISLVGRRIMSAAKYNRRGFGKDRNGSGVVLFGLAITIIGYAGLFFARWIKSAISRQREYLADASAVQYTRDVSGIGGALKKIAVSGHTFPVYADMEEVSHMLFGQAGRAFLFATHPPILDRIRRIEPGFDATNLEEFALRMEAGEAKSRESTAEDEKNSVMGEPGPGLINPTEFLANIGRPAPAAMLAAAALVANLPDQLDSYARTLEWAPAVLLYTLLDPDAEIQGRQLSLISEYGSPDDAARTRHLASTSQPLRHEQRLPLFELVFPTLKRRPVAQIQAIRTLADLLVHADDRVDTFEYMLSRAIKAHLDDAMNPAVTRIVGRLDLGDCQTEVRIIISVLVRNGHEHDSAMQTAFERGLALLDFAPGPLAKTGAGWPSILDSCLHRVDRLSGTAKERFVKALVGAIEDDQRVVSSELEMVRAICASMHVPLPIPV
jgi:Zn-dependent protease with chaperone function